jgi:hypothetical protein
MGPNQIQYYEVTKQDFIKGFDIVQDKMKANGDANRYEKFWSQYNNDPQFKDKIMTRIMTKYNEQLAAQKALDAKLNK